MYVKTFFRQISFAEKYWDSTATGFRQTHHSLSLVGLPTFQDGKQSQRLSGGRKALESGRFEMP